MYTLEKYSKIKITYKSEQGKIKKWKSRIRMRSSNKCNKKSLKFIWLKRKNNIYRNHSILLSEAKYKAKHGKGLKILTPKQMLQRLPIALAEVKAVNTSENLLNEIRQIIYYLYQEKKLLKKVYNNATNSIKL